MEINAKFNEDPRVAKLQKSLILVWSKGGLQVLSAASSIPKVRLEEIATGDVDPEGHEISMLQMLAGA